IFVDDARLDKQLDPECLELHGRDRLPSCAAAARGDLAGIGEFTADEDSAALAFHDDDVRFREHPRRALLDQRREPEANRVEARDRTAAKDMLERPRGRLREDEERVEDGFDAEDLRGGPELRARPADPT